VSESLLFSPITLRGITSRNRIWVAPMARYSAPESGVPTDWHLAHLGGMARGGAGLVMTETTAVEPAGRLGAADTGAWNDDRSTHGGNHSVRVGHGRHSCDPTGRLQP